MASGAIFKRPRLPTRAREEEHLMSTLQRIGWAAAAASLAIGAVSIAVAQPGAYRGPHVDVSQLLSNNGEPTASWVAQEMPAALAAAGAGPVSVSIHYVTLRPDSSAWLNGWAPDLMVGEVTSGGVTRELSAENPYIPSPVNNTMIEQSNRIRVSRLVRTFAQWAARGY
jgi:hypothetical protein